MTAWDELFSIARMIGREECGHLYHAVLYMLRELGVKDDDAIQFLHEQGVSRCDDFDKEKERLVKLDLYSTRDTIVENFPFIKKDSSMSAESWVYVSIALLASFLITRYLLIRSKRKNEKHVEETYVEKYTESISNSDLQSISESKDSLPVPNTHLSLAIVLRADKIGSIKLHSSCDYQGIARFLEEKQYFICCSPEKLANIESSLTLRSKEIDEGSERSAYIRIDFSGPSNLPEAKFFSLKKSLQRNKDISFKIGNFGMLDEVGGIIEKGFNRG